MSTRIRPDPHGPRASRAQRNLVQAEENPPPPQGVPYPAANRRRARARPLGRNANHLYEFALEVANPAAPRRPLSLFTARCPLYRNKHKGALSPVAEANARMHE